MPDPVPDPYFICPGRSPELGPGWLVGSMAWNGRAEWFATEAEARAWLADYMDHHRQAS